MSNYFNLLSFFLLLSLCLFSCDIGDEDDDDEDTEEMVQLPDLALTYISANYPDFGIEESELETICYDNEVYEVELDSDDTEKELTFDSDGNFLYEEVEISDSELPEIVYNSISDTYPDYKIDDTYRLDLVSGVAQYKVEIEQGENELEIYIDSDGTIICELIEEDDD